MTREKLDPRAEIGEQFERDVAEIYTAMGFSVARHVPIDGQEVDILAERHLPGVGMYRVMVECKYKGGRSFAGNEDVQSIADAYRISQRSHQVSACTLVTTNGFSLPARMVAKSTGIQLITKRELIRDLLDFTPYFQALRDDYIIDFGEGEKNWYIPARGRQDDQKIPSLAEFVDQWRAKEEKRPLIILGGYGTGKTSFCRDYARRLIESNSEVFPVIIPLREFQRTRKIESAIRDFLEEKCNAPSPRFELFAKMYKEGLILLIFDGFDEMAQMVNADALEFNLAEIESFVRSSSNLILTCRPEIFTTAAEESHALEPSLDLLSDRRVSYERVEMELWEPDQVAAFVRKRVTAIKAANPTTAKSPEFYLSHIDRLPILQDMSARAVHLELIVRMLPEMIAENMLISRTNLYGTYIKREFRRETVRNRRLSLIPDDDRVALLQQASARSFLKGRINLDFETAATLVEERLHPPRSELDSMTRELLNRSFLHRQGDVYEFAHKSLGEYLFATYIEARIREGDLNFLHQNWNSPTVAGIVLELFGGIRGTWDLAKHLGLQRDQKLTDVNLPAVRFISGSMYDYTALVPRRGRAAKELKDMAALFLLLSTIDQKAEKSLNSMWTLFGRTVDKLEELFVSQAVLLDVF